MDRPRRRAFLAALGLIGVLGSVDAQAQTTAAATKAQTAHSAQASRTSAMVCSGVGPVPCTTSRSLTMTLQRGGNLSAPVVLTQGTPNLDFTDVGSGTCTTNGPSHNYSAGDTCTVVVNFSPRTSGIRMGAVRLLDVNGGLMSDTLISGVGTGAIAVFPGHSLEVVLGSGFYFPSGVAVDSAGNVFVADFVNGQVKEIVAGNGSINAVPYGFGNPAGVAVDGAGNIYVADAEDNVVYKVSSGGNVSTVGGNNFDSPRGVAVDSAGNVYVANFGESEIDEIYPNGGVNAIGSNFNYPYGVAVDGAGNVFVADTGNDEVKEILAVDGIIPYQNPTIRTLGNGFVNPSGVAVDGVGNVYVSDDSGTQEIIAVGGSIPDSNPAVLSLGGAASGGVAVDSSGNVYLAEPRDNQVVELTLGTLPPFSFASTPVGTTSSDSPRTWEVENIGSSALDFSKLSVQGDDFTMSSAGTCNTATSLAPSGLCTVEVTFTPKTAGARVGKLMLADNSTGASGAIQEAALTGTATPAPVMAPHLSSTKLAFGSVTIGSGSSTKVVTLTNDRPTTLRISGMKVIGADITSFVFGTNCPASLLAGKSCTIHGYFDPKLAGTLTAEVSIKYLDAVPSQTIALTGIGLTAPKAVLSASSLAFGTEKVGTSTASKQITLTNSGGASLSISSISTTGQNASSFVFSNDCPESLAGGSSCLIKGHFTPKSTGHLAATIKIVDKTCGSSKKITLSGTGH